MQALGRHHTLKPGDYLFAVRFFAIFQSLSECVLILITIRGCKIRPCDYPMYKFSLKKKSFSDIIYYC